MRRSINKAEVGGQKAEVRNFLLPSAFDLLPSIQEHKTIQINNETIESWFDSGWYFRAKIYSNGEWHVWASKAELVDRSALHEPWDSVVYFKFGATKDNATDELWKQIVLCNY